MKFLHLSDLHLGKRLNGYSLLEDQQDILQKILDIAEEERPDGVLLAGDVYDKSIPPAEAVTVFDSFLVALKRRNIPVYAISGNHDSPERLAFGGRLMEESGYYISPLYDGTVKEIYLTDSYGKVRLFLLPFLKPAHVRHAFPDAEIRTYTDAIALALSTIPKDDTARSVLVTHQFVTGAALCDSEEISVGGSDQVDGAVFDGFDYVALGHLHGPQQVGRETVRYCGTPLKYSFSEIGHKKSVTVVELREKGNVSVRTIPLVPRRDLSQLKGTYEELAFRGNYERFTNRNDYLHIILTDEEDIFDAAAKLRTIYPNLMKLSYDNQRTRTETNVAALESTPQKSPLSLLEEFYVTMNGSEMSEEQRSYAAKQIEALWEETV